VDCREAEPENEISRLRAGRLAEFLEADRRADVITPDGAPAPASTSPTSVASMPSRRIASPNANPFPNQILEGFHRRDLPPHFIAAIVAACNPPASPAPRRRGRNRFGNPVFLSETPTRMAARSGSDSQPPW
jgi:hypothetical protein